MPKKARNKFTSFLRLLSVRDYVVRNFPLNVRKLRKLQPTETRVRPKMRMSKELDAD
jgi:hypothetical protein